MKLYVFRTSPEGWLDRYYVVMAKDVATARGTAIRYAREQEHDAVWELEENEPVEYGENKCLVFEVED